VSTVCVWQTAFNLPPGALYIVCMRHAKVVQKQFRLVRVTVRVSQCFLETKVPVCMFNTSTEATYFS